MKNFNLQSKLEVPENKVIILDLAGYTITNKYFLINNYGNLDIENSGDEGKIVFDETSTGMVNHGELILSKVTITCSGSGNYHIIYAIYNDSIKTINRGHLERQAEFHASTQDEA